MGKKRKQRRRGRPGQPRDGAAPGPAASARGVGLAQQNRASTEPATAAQATGGRAQPPTSALRSRVLTLSVRLGFFLIAGAAATLMLWPAWATVFPADGTVQLLGTDAFYHVRHAAYSFAHYPSLLRWDLGIYPHGARALYAGLFDTLIATAGRLVPWVVGTPDDIVRVAVFIPPLLGVLSFLVLFRLASAMHGRLAALLSGVSLLLFPAAFMTRMLLGFVDHHALEILLALLCLLGFERCLAVDRPWRRPAFLEAAPLSAFLFSWYGAPLYVLLAATAFVLVVTLRVGVGQEVQSTGRSALRYAVGAAIPTWALALVFPTLIMEQRALLLASAGFVGIGAGVPVYAAGLSLARRRFPGLLVAVVGLLVYIALFLVLGRIEYSKVSLLDHALAPKTGVVTEQVAVTWRAYVARGGAPALLAWLALPLVIYRAKKGRLQGAPGTLFAFLIVALWLRTHDYGYVAAACLALLAGFVGAELLPRRRGPRLAYAAVLGLAYVLPTWPLAWTKSPRVAEGTVRDLVSMTPAWRGALAWMRHELPELEQPIDAKVPPGDHPDHPPGNYGVRAFWEHGHAIAWLSRRPVLIGGAISGYDAGWFLNEDENEANSIARYVIVDAESGGQFFQLNAQFARSTLQNYIRVAGELELGGRRLRRWVYNPRYLRTLSGRFVDGEGRYLEHYRMVYVSPELAMLAWEALPNGSVWRRTTLLETPEDVAAARAIPRDRVRRSAFGVKYDTVTTSAIKVFEHVRGATLDLPAPPGEVVEVVLRLHARTADRTFEYSNRERAGRRGRVHIGVPYPSDGAPPYSDLVPLDARYEVRLGDGTRLGDVAVSREAVENGERIAVAAF